MFIAGAVLTSVALVAPLLILGVLREGTRDSIDAVNIDTRPFVVQVTPRTVTDDKPVNVEVTIEQGLALRAPNWGGVIASLQPGTTLKSGDPLAVIDGVTRVALHTPEPLFRPLTRGDTGSDVEQLNLALVALGYLETQPPNASEYGLVTVQAVRAWAKDIGVRSPDGSFQPAWVVWLPKAEFAVGEWLLEPGATAPPVGTVIGREPPNATAARVVSRNPVEPLSLEPTLDWVLVVEDLVLPVDPLSLGLAANDAVQLGSLLAPDKNQLAGIVRRRDPLNAVAAPSTAVQVGIDGALCVWVPDGAGFRARAVEVALARAGVTNITAGLFPGESILSNPVDVLENPSCPSD